MRLKDLQDKVDFDEYEVFALRADSRSFLPGEAVPNSHTWVQDDPEDKEIVKNDGSGDLDVEYVLRTTADPSYNPEIGCWDMGELDGTCGVKLDKNDIEGSFEKVKDYLRNGYNLYLIAGNSYEYGDDSWNDEVVIKDAVCIDKVMESSLLNKRRNVMESAVKCILAGKPVRKAVMEAMGMYGMDDGFFTKEELVEFAYDVEDDVNEYYKSKNSPFRIGYAGVWLEDDGRTVTMDFACYPNETVYSASVKIDMRAINAQRDIYKYKEKMADEIKAQVEANEVMDH